MTAVLVVGDANPDLILRGDIVPRFGQAEQLLDDAAFVIGGSAAITAHGLARLGRQVFLAAAVGTDTAGVRLLDELDAAGVDLRCIVRRSGMPTGLSVILSGGPGGESDRAILTLPGAVPTLTAADVRAAIEATGPAHLHVSSLFLQPQLGRDLALVLAKARAAGITTSLDTNDDPAGAWDGIGDLLPHLDLLLPNRAEALALSRTLSRAEAAADAPEAAMRLAGAGPVVVVKDGASGAFAVRTGEPLISVPAPARPSADTTGAGDTFDAAFIDAWLTGLSLPTCLERATHAGALAVAGIGGTAAQPTAAELDASINASIDPAADPAPSEAPEMERTR